LEGAAGTILLSNIDANPPDFDAGRGCFFVCKVVDEALTNPIDIGFEL
jgi:hypothetical protein